MSKKYTIDHDWGFGTSFESEEAFFEAWKNHMAAKSREETDRFAPDLSDSNE